MLPREIDVLISQGKHGNDKKNEHGNDRKWKATRTPSAQRNRTEHSNKGVLSMMMTGIMPVFKFRIELFPEPVGNRSQLFFRQIHCRHEPETTHRFRTTF